VIVHTYWGRVSQTGRVITLDADEEKAKGGDGIGSVLTFVEWDGKPLRLTVERTKVWRPEPWADLWFVATEHGEPAAWMRKPWPMRYLRFTSEVCEMGESRGPAREDQRIHLTAKWWDLEGIDAVWDRQDGYRVSWSDGALHVDPLAPNAWEQTYSMPAPVCELGLYVEGCVCEVTVERTGE